MEDVFREGCALIEPLHPRVERYARSESFCLWSWPFAFLINLVPHYNYSKSISSSYSSLGTICLVNDFMVRCFCLHTLFLSFVLLFSSTLLMNLVPYTFNSSHWSLVPDTPRKWFHASRSFLFDSAFFPHSRAEHERHVKAAFEARLKQKGHIEVIAYFVGAKR